MWRGATAGGGRSGGGGGGPDAGCRCNCPACSAERISSLNFQLSTQLATAVTPHDSKRQPRSVWNKRGHVDSNDNKNRATLKDRSCLLCIELAYSNVCTRYQVPGPGMHEQCLGGALPMFVVFVWYLMYASPVVKAVIDHMLIACRCIVYALFCCCCVHWRHTCGGGYSLAGKERGITVCYYVIMPDASHRRHAAATTINSSIVRACNSRLFSG